MSNVLEDQRGFLVDALRVKRSDAPWRVHRFVPDKLTAPCVFIGAPRLDLVTIGSPGVRFTQVTFPVCLVVDGASRSQAAQLDAQLAAVWDAAFEVGTPIDATPQPIDVGGGKYLSGTVVQVEVPLRAITLCSPTLEAVNG
jgi:hypothetical protein